MPENFFCLFLEQEIFFSPALRSGRIIFLNPQKLILLNRGGGGLQETFQPSYDAKSHFQSFWSE